MSKDELFSELTEELERTGEIIRQWENGEPEGIEPQQKPKTNENEKERRTI